MRGDPGVDDEGFGVADVGEVGADHDFGVSVSSFF